MSREFVEVSVVLPAYNEAATIRTTVETTLDALAAFLPPDAFEVIVAEDGCEDETPEIADEMAAADDRVRHFHADERLGRGGALERAFEASAGETLVYFDTDMATDMRHLEELVESVRTEGYDVATGSRWIAGREADRPAKRGVPSRVFNGLTRLFLRSDLQDHQCGFKAFDRAALLELMPVVQDQHWFWDTEVLVKAQRRGMRVKEFPVDWEPKGDTKVDLVRDVFGMGSQIVRTWWELSVSPRVNRRVGIVAGTLLTLVAIGLMPLYLDPGEVLDKMAGADPALVAASAVVYLLSWPLRGVRYRDILSEIGYDSDVGFLTGAIFISQTGNLVFPARAGDAVRAYVVKARRGIPYPSGFASLAVERVFDLLTITMLAGSVLIALVATGNAADLQAALAGEAASGDVGQSGQTAVYLAAVVGILAIGSVVAIVASARTDGNRIEAALQSISSDSYVGYVAGVLEQFVGDIQRVASDGRAFSVIAGSSVVIWTLDVLTAVVVMRAFGGFDVLALPWLLAVAFFAVSVGNLAKVLPLTPGGVGLYEGAFTLLVVALTPASVGAEVALAVAVVDHFVKNVVTVVGGLGSMLVLNVSLTEAVAESADEVDPAESEPAKQ
ncbi:flippase-like domain-containing protein [Halorubellus sp. JP-L1]|uniref:flippase-like domain-containing protein n=1 Tax=Halorubellus sp. JP-L1 TaxID=2715753 RepID=UPI00140DBF47|nr:flippase-like domain-containing protein [Halorubellus sp. JP-L1]NHN42424.1 flippase-like domain-containing protein [Halorubellus sp. JP-L1]